MNAAGKEFADKTGNANAMLDSLELIVALSHSGFMKELHMILGQLQETNGFI